MKIVQSAVLSAVAASALLTACGTGSHPAATTHAAAASTRSATPAATSTLSPACAEIEATWKTFAAHVSGTSNFEDLYHYLGTLPLEIAKDEKAPGMFPALASNEGALSQDDYSVMNFRSEAAEKAAVTRMGVDMATIRSIC